MTVVILLTFGLLHLRLAQLQIVEGARFARLAENNRLRRIPVPASRGRIFDRTGQILADNRPAWQLLVFPDEAEDLKETAAFLSAQGVMAEDVFRGQLDSRTIGTMAPMLVGEDLSWEQVARIRSHQIDFPELSIINGFSRNYPAGPAAAHVVGYLRRLTPTEARERPAARPDHLVGATGIESLSESFLGGTDGERFVVASAVGKQLGVVRETEAISGRDLAVTLDIRLQHAAVGALGEHAGAVVVLDAQTGAVRTLYSAPSFDPNIFTSPLSRETWHELSNDPLHPLQNRCLQGTYPPGSTIKPFFALAGLENSLITPGWSVYCPGYIILFGHRFRCWQRGGHGRVNLQRSLEVSCDVYYYLLGQKHGIDGLASTMRQFGFGATTGIGMSNESRGLVGTPEWSRRVRGTPWYAGESVSVSIGQGPVLTTALQLARAYAALANGGRLVRPHLVAPQGVNSDPRIPVSPSTLAEIVQGLRRVVHGSEGTARRLRDLPVAGKTGTVQVVRLPEEGSSDDLPLHLRHHAWFVGWAPIDNPEITVAVLVEHGGGGGSVAAPAATSVFRTALEISGRLPGASRPGEPGEISRVESP